jgi:hypothetical protein
VEKVAKSSTKTDEIPLRRELVIWVSHRTRQRILREDLNIWRISVNFVPRLLTDEQKQQSVCARNCLMKHK